MSSPKSCCETASICICLLLLVCATSFLAISLSPRTKPLVIFTTRSREATDGLGLKIFQVQIYIWVFASRASSVKRWVYTLSSSSTSLYWPVFFTQKTRETFWKPKIIFSTFHLFATTLGWHKYFVNPFVNQSCISSISVW